MSYIDAMGRTLLQTMEVTPQGMLVFFASYSQMYSMIEELKVISQTNGMGLKFEFLEADIFGCEFLVADAAWKGSLCGTQK